MSIAFLPSTSEILIDEVLLFPVSSWPDSARHSDSDDEESIFTETVSVTKLSCGAAHASRCFDFSAEQTANRSAHLELIPSFEHLDQMLGISRKLHSLIAL